MERIPERLSEDSLRRRREHEKRRKGHFLAGPIPVTWLATAQRLGGSALAVGLAVWFKTRVESDGKAVPICPDLLARFGVQYHTGRRGLLALEQAGLVSVERRSGACPLVTIRKGKA